MFHRQRGGECSNNFGQMVIQKVVTRIIHLRKFRWCFHLLYWFSTRHQKESNSRRHFQVPSNACFFRWVVRPTTTTEPAACSHQRLRGLLWSLKKPRMWRADEKEALDFKRKKNWKQRLAGGFKHFFVFTPTWGWFPIWLIFFKWVETTRE